MPALCFRHTSAGGTADPDSISKVSAAVPVQGFTQEITGVLLGWSSFLVSEPCLGQGGRQPRCEGKFGVKGVTEVG